MRTVIIIIAIIVSAICISTLRSNLEPEKSLSVLSERVSEIEPVIKTRVKEIKGQLNEEKSHAMVEEPQPIEETVKKQKPLNPEIDKKPKQNLKTVVITVPQEVTPKDLPEQTEDFVFDETEKAVFDEPALFEPEQEPVSDEDEMTISDLLKVISALKEEDNG